MSFHIQQDDQSQKFEMYEGQDLSWTLYDGDLHYGFFATHEDAEAGLEDLRIDAREEVEKKSRSLGRSWKRRKICWMNWRVYKHEQSKNPNRSHRV